MQTYRAPVREMRFVLEAFGYEQISSLEAFSAYDMETVVALLEQTGSFAVSTLLPTNKPGDQVGLKWDAETGAVTTPPGFREAYGALRDNGYIGITGPEAYGGGNGPETLGIVMGEISSSCNKSLAMCPGLTRGLIEALEHHGSDEQKQTYLPNLISGSWSGTMCLTEPQCGTDLGLVSTKATPEGDHYRLTGTKIWITFGEHDLTENIVHLVLARLPDAPEGIKGISTFLVPKFTNGAKRNPVKCIGLEHKMGIHGSPTCVIEMDEAEGYLIGEPHKGMKVMFTMMNAARLHVGVEAISGAEIAYQTAVAFAKERRQSRSLDPAKRDRSASADNILVHPDVRRMLLNQKATNEGMRALALWTAMQIDLSRQASDEKVQQEADDLAALLTPIVKAYCTERGTANISEAMQVCGGSGFTQDWNIEQYYRDTRITMIYEGTNHIQALDLVGRKLPMHGGRLMQVFGARVTDMIRSAKEDPRMAEFVEPLKAASKTLTTVTMELAAKGMADAEEAGAAATNYLSLFGLTTLAYVWAVMAKKALDEDSAFARTKLKTARYFFQNVLPESESLVSLIRAGKANMMAFDAEELDVA
ncbi:MAG: acyl-CoA dehydrogenase C-terminal domain-containing protein [Myxococcales bacterium]|nr:acyl-CoA dehydrogenase C-terminal domain-containing protein [Myxococcales bacterium]MCB9649419.1 acyl-CoA dehydrogenase C-terminal domain-containing protein [Deltaproteobacteria bacterium]